MDLRLPEKHCEKNEEGFHFFTNVMGNIWRCKLCWAAKWIPCNWDTAVKYSADIKKMGPAHAYRKWVGKRPKVAEIIGKMEELRILRDSVPKEDLPKYAQAILQRKEVEKAVIEDELITSIELKTTARIGET